MYDGQGFDQGFHLGQVIILCQYFRPNLSPTYYPIQDLSNLLSTQGCEWGHRALYLRLISYVKSMQTHPRGDWNLPRQRITSNPGHSVLVHLSHNHYINDYHSGSWTSILIPNNFSSLLIMHSIFSTSTFIPTP